MSNYSETRRIFKGINKDTVGKYGIENFSPIDQPIYHYTSAEAAKNILCSGRLFMSQAERFNDPFDLNNSLLTVDKTPAHGWEKEIIEIYSSENRYDWSGLTFEEKTLSFRMENLKKDLDFIKSHVRIGSFSRLHDNTLMWSHYADKHSGICLGFDYSLLASNKILVADVKYVDKITPLDYYGDYKQSLLHWIFTKSSVWEYEKEVRAIMADEEPYSPFIPDALVSIHFGVKTSKDEIAIIEKILKAFNYNLKIKALMVMDTEKFRVKEQKL